MPRVFLNSLELLTNIDGPVLTGGVGRMSYAYVSRLDHRFEELRILFMVNICNFGC